MNKKKNNKKVSIGGQAVMEGVMMKSQTSMATAVRDNKGNILIESERLKNSKSKISKFPIIRGVIAFFTSFYSGTKTLMRSASVFGEDEPTKFEKWCAKKFKVNILDVVAFFSLILGLILAVFLFIFLPQQSRIWILGENANPWAKNFLEGGLKLLIFVCYILLCSLIKDVRRTFMYHGAEHKTISCFEKGLELTSENAKKCSRVHNRCGTTFIFFVMFISIVVFAVFESVLASYSVSLNKLVRVLCKIALLPLVAGLSYELLKALAKTDSPIFLPLKAPGLLLQRITTKEPTLDMLEVAIASFKTVMDMDNDKTVLERTFDASYTRKEIFDAIYEKLKLNGIDEEAEAEWIISITLDISRSQVKENVLVLNTLKEKIDKIVNERITRRPLWYCIGDTDFYGYKIKVNENVLIPRPETELLVEKALDSIDETKKVLDLCTGSGAIAIAVSKKKNASVTAVDISEKALEVAKKNAKLNGANVNFILSDMFSELADEKFDVIISNPPYIKTEDIKTLQKEVKDFEPILALDGGEDGLKFYRIIAKNAKNYLNENGVLYLECGIDEAKDVAFLFSNFKKVSIIKDYENIDRIVKAVL